MLACNTLRIDHSDSSQVVEYRIENDRVESRTLETAVESDTRKEWKRLSPEQLSSHVMAHTVVAHWLRGRMGVHRLIRACNATGNDSEPRFPERSAA